MVVDDFILVGFGDTEYGASKNHNDPLHTFPQRCDGKNLKLNKEKLKFRQKEVPFIGHMATAKGLIVDLHKVQAIIRKYHCQQIWRESDASWDWHST